MNSFQSGEYSLLLMYAILASGAFYVSSDIIADCGFRNRMEAQMSFCSRATLLHDFQYEANPVATLQSALILGAVVSSQTENGKDFHYWFYISVRLLARVDPHKDHQHENKDQFSKLYRRMWWTLYVCNSIPPCLKRPRSWMFIDDDEVPRYSTQLRRNPTRHWPCSP